MTWTSLSPRRCSQGHLRADKVSLSVMKNKDRGQVVLRFGPLVARHLRVEVGDHLMVSLGDAADAGTLRLEREELGYKVAAEGPLLRVSFSGSHLNLGPETHSPKVMDPKMAPDGSVIVCVPRWLRAHLGVGSEARRT